MADTSPPGVDDSTASGVDDHDDSVGGVAGGGEEAAAAAAASASAGAAGAADAGGEEGDTPQFLLANFDSDSTKREIGNEAVWTLSSAKSGNGVDQLRDNDINTFWQSDGTQPHEVNIQFLCKKSICAISFYLEHKLDESYTPKKISIRAGDTYHDQEQVCVLELEEPSGWITVPLELSMDQTCYTPHPRDHEPLRAHLVQVSVDGMHQNGRDTHIRQIKIYGPRTEATPLASLPKFRTLALSTFGSLR
eukprot:INCI6077.2.p1 GENE.INCI6077.2~~INCI6077.2.p1  ORF type:complete len:249 (-),score=54.07 INCI6077.2:137-883(-)